MCAPAHRLEACAHVECWQPATVELRHPGIGPDGSSGVWLGWCRRHARRYDGLDERTIGGG